MPRWRKSTWAFIIWNLVMVAALWLVFSPDVWLGESCDRLPYGSDRTACAMGAGLGGAFLSILGFLAVVLIWPLGSVVMGSLWLKRRPSRHDRGGSPTNHPPRPRITRSHTGSNRDAVLAAAASNVVEWQTVGLVLVEAAWTTRPMNSAVGPFRLGVAFGKPGVRFERLWPDEEDVTEVVLALVPNVHGARRAGS